MKISLYALCLAALWYVLSGHSEALILGFGALSVGLVALLARRMGLIDAEGFPIQILPGLPRYATWLCARIIESNIAVARLILDPRLPIHPSRVRLTAASRSDVARVCYANSITLTPGTITLGIDDADLEVHALTVEAAADLERGAMNSQVARLERWT